MVLGMVVPSLASVFAIRTRAEYTYDSYADDTIVRVGLLYGNNAVTAFLTKTPEGFDVYSVGDDDVAEKIYTLKFKALEAVVDCNLSLSNGDYIKADAQCDIGAYHVTVDADLTLDELYLAMNHAASNGIDAHLIASYDAAAGAYRLLIGSFADAAAAENYLNAIEGAFDVFETANDTYSYTMSVISPSESAVCLINPENNMTVFRYDGYGESELGLSAMDYEGETAYLQTPANKLYDGIFMFVRQNGGVALINFISLEDYIKGVLPYEISNSWPLETQKAFAICARSYAVNMLGRHKKDGFDLCNTVCCQTYNGVRRVNETVEQAVSETRGQVIVSESGEIITAYYSAVSGGTMISATDAWGGNESYLQPSVTPWEDYGSHSNGTWVWEVSPSELGKLLASKGLELSGAITDINIDKVSDSGEYVTKITFTDENGKKASVTNADNIRIKLAPNIKSANFKVAKGSLTVNDPCFDPDNDGKLFSYITSNGEGSILYTDFIPSATSKGFVKNWAGVNTAVITADGVVYPDCTYEIKAEDPSNYLFVGKGWGHGVGLSQVGACSLGKQGFDAEFILKAYFAGAEIAVYSESEEYPL